MRSNLPASRITALLLAVALLLSVTPIPAYAQGSVGESGVTQEAGAPGYPGQGGEGDTATEEEAASVDEADKGGPANRAPAAEPPATLGYSSIVAFAPLDGDVARQEVATGTSLADLDLPDTLAATVEDEEGNQTDQDVPVARWSAAPDYDPQEMGAYTFTPELGLGYTLEDSAALPEITVRVVMGIMATAAGDVEINATNFPDAAFRAYVSMDTIDLNKDGVLSAEEMAAVTFINVYNMGISDLKGIEHFTALKTLYCDTNNLTALDVSQNTALTDLLCNNNNLTALDVSQNTALKTLYCYTNNLTALDVSNNPALTDLRCQNNSLTTLNMSGCSSINSLFLSYTNNPIRHLKMPNGDSLLVDIAPADGGAVILTHNIFPLDYVWFDTGPNYGYNFTGWTGDGTGTATRTVSFTPSGDKTVTAHFEPDTGAEYHLGDVAVINKIIRENGLTGYSENDPAGWGFATWSGASNNKRIVKLEIGYQSLVGTLDVTGLEELAILNCRNNNLVGLNVSGLPSLTEINCRNNRLTSLDVSGLASLTLLNSYSNELTELVNLPVSLKTLYCNGNPITTLDVSYLPLLEYLNCAGIGLESLEVGGTNLQELHCNDNSLTSLDVSGLPLTTFACQGNPLTSITLQSGQVLTVAISGLGTVQLTGHTHDPVTPRFQFTATAAHALYSFGRWESNSNDVSLGDPTSTVLDFTIPATGDIGLTAVFVDATHPGDVEVINKIIRENGLTGYSENDPVNWDFVTRWSGETNDKRIEALDLSKHVGMASTVDLTGLAELSNLACNSNPNLTELNVTGLEKLTTLWCNNNPNLTELNVSGLKKLTTLYCFNNSLDVLDVTNTPALTDLQCNNNNLATLDVTQNTNLRVLYCNNNNLTTLDLPDSTALIGLDCNGNRLTALDVSKNSALKTLYCGSNRLTTLDVSNNSALTQLSCYSNNLAVLDVSQNSALTDLRCYSNNLAALDVSKNTALEQLYCNSNNLAALDVAKNSALKILYCYNNNLAALDVMNNPALTQLHCYSNNLAALDVTQNAALEHLYCYSNSLTILDLTKNTALQRLRCYDNSLTVLDITGCVSLKTNFFGIENNPYQSLTLPGGERLQVQASPAEGGTVMMTAFNLPNKEVELTAAPAGPFDAVVWTGSESGTARVLQFPVNGDMAVTANFRTSGDAQTPGITSQPQGGEYTINAPATLAVTASVSDGGVLSYQWYSNNNDNNSGGNMISGARWSAYAPPTGAVGTIYYYVEITNENNYATGSKTATIASATAAVTVNEHTNAQMPVIDTQPTGGSFTQDTAVTLKVEASIGDGGLLSYQWYRNADNSNVGGTAISGAINSSYSPPTADVGTAYYYVVVTNTNNSPDVTGSTTATITSNTAAVTVTASGDNGGPSSYTVSYHGNGGTGRVPVDDYVESGRTYTIAGPTNLTAPDGKQFKEWNTNSTGSGTGYTPGQTITMPNYTLTLYAIWADIPATGIYTITFHPGGGSVSPSTMQTGGDGKLASLPTPTRSRRYAFAGWYTAASGGTKITTSTVFAADTTVYASWRYTGSRSSGNNGGPDRPGQPTNILTFDGLPDVVRVGVPFTLIPSSDTQRGSDGWTWDTAYFDATFNSPATFTPLKEGATTISYTGLTGSRGEVTVTILAAAEDAGTHNPDTGGGTKDNPQPGDIINNPWWLELIPAAALILYGLTRLRLRLRSMEG